MWPIQIKYGHGLERQDLFLFLSKFDNPDINRLWDDFEDADGDMLEMSNDWTENLLSQGEGKTHPHDVQPLSE